MTWYDNFSSSLIPPNLFNFGFMLNGFNCFSSMLKSRYSFPCLGQNFWFGNYRDNYFPTYQPKHNWESSTSSTIFGSSFYDRPAWGTLGQNSRNLFSFNPTNRIYEPLSYRERFERLKSEANYTFSSAYTPSEGVKFKNIADQYVKQWKISEKTLADGTKVMACGWSRFEKLQPEWTAKQKYLIQAANEMGLTLVYSDAERTVRESNIGRKNKGNIVCAGGNSPHNYGTAVDIVLLKDGVPISVNSQTQTDFANRVKALSNNTITWGGDWSKKGERHHFELKGWQKYQSPKYLVG